MSKNCLDNLHVKLPTYTYLINFITDQELRFARKPPLRVATIYFADDFARFC